MNESALLSDGIDNPTGLVDHAGRPLQKDPDPYEDRSEHFSKDNALPDSRMTHTFTPKGAFMGADGVWYVPTFCANCGVRGPDTPQENMTFMFYLCDKRRNGCFEKYGEIAGTMAIPDHVFWERVKQEQIDTFGRELTIEELLSLSENSALYKLLKERPKPS